MPGPWLRIRLPLLRNPLLPRPAPTPAPEADRAMPAATAPTPAPDSAPQSLPHTASPYPMIGLVGLLSLAGYAVLRVARAS